MWVCSNLRDSVRFTGRQCLQYLPEKAVLQGTIRTYDPSIQAVVHQRMREIVENTARAFGASAELQIDQIVPAAYNDPQMAALTRRLSVGIFGEENIEVDYRVSPSDDVAEFLNRHRCQVILVCRGRRFLPHHNPRVDIDERARPQGVLCLADTDELFQRLMFKTPINYPERRFKKKDKASANTFK